ncbi:MAG: tRNA pseudouridine(55) synthase TruB [Clostridia bacterium]|nr:tRNA pseudouridine(55) synthase TruB [Clostridia bacterium]
MMNQATKEPCGVLLIDKPKGLTSHDVVGRIRRLYHTRRVGHTGTLDPLATGVLVVLIGRAAKAAEYLVSDRKKYRAELLLGRTTDTEDVTGTILTESADIPPREAVYEAAARFVGTYDQVPPMYSALKVGGQKLVDLARRGVEIERKSRPVTIHSLVCTPTDDPAHYVLEIACSAGTYIRTLCADIGKTLGCGGVMAELRRTETGGFALKDCHTLEELETKDDSARAGLLIPTESLFADLPTLPLPAFYEKLARSGCEIYQKKIGTEHAEGTRVRMCGADGSFFALGEVREYPDGSAVKPVKFFDIGE